MDETLTPQIDVHARIQAALRVIDQAVGLFNPKMVVALMSGGDDSLPATYIASLHPRFSGVLHINTGIGIKETREHVRKICADQDWWLWEYKATENVKANGAPDPQRYEDLVLRYGFPGPSGHGMMYNRLKQRQLAQFEREHRVKTRHPVLYVSGRRSQESKRRMLTVPSSIMEKKGRRAFVSPIHDWSRQDCAIVREQAGLPRNEVAARIHMSGECLCGAFAKDGELDEIAFWYPEAGAYIRDLEKRVKAAGFPWGWGEKPPEWWMSEKRGQLPLFPTTPESEQHLCYSCNKRGLSPGGVQAQRTHFVKNKV